MNRAQSARVSPTARGQSPGNSRPPPLRNIASSNALLGTVGNRSMTGNTISRQNTTSFADRQVSMRVASAFRAQKHTTSSIRLAPIILAIVATILVFIGLVLSIVGAPMHSMYMIVFPHHDNPSLMQPSGSSSDSDNTSYSSVYAGAVETARFGLFSFCTNGNCRSAFPFEALTSWPTFVEEVLGITSDEVKHPSYEAASCSRTAGVLRTRFNGVGASMIIGIVAAALAFITYALLAYNLAALRSYLDKQAGMNVFFNPKVSHREVVQSTVNTMARQPSMAASFPLNNHGYYRTASTNFDELRYGAGTASPNQNRSIALDGDRQVSTTSFTVGDRRLTAVPSQTQSRPQGLSDSPPLPGSPRLGVNNSSVAQNFGNESMSLSEGTEAKCGVVTRKMLQVMQHKADAIIPLYALSLSFAVISLICMGVGLGLYAYDAQLYTFCGRTMCDLLLVRNIPSPTCSFGTGFALLLVGVCFVTFGGIVCSIVLSFFMFGDLQASQKMLRARQTGKTLEFSELLHIQALHRAIIAENGDAERHTYAQSGQDEHDFSDYFTPTRRHGERNMRTFSAEEIERIQDEENDSPPMVDTPESPIGLKGHRVQMSDIHLPVADGDIASPRHASVTRACDDVGLAEFLPGSFIVTATNPEMQRSSTSAVHNASGAGAEVRPILLSSSRRGGAPSPGQLLAERPVFPQE